MVGRGGWWPGNHRAPSNRRRVSRAALGETLGGREANRVISCRGERRPEPGRWWQRGERRPRRLRGARRGLRSETREQTEEHCWVRGACSAPGPTTRASGLPRGETEPSSHVRAVPRSPVLRCPREKPFDRRAVFSALRSPGFFQKSGTLSPHIPLHPSPGEHGAWVPTRVSPRESAKPRVSSESVRSVSSLLVIRSLVSLWLWARPDGGHLHTSLAVALLRPINQSVKHRT